MRLRHLERSRFSFPERPPVLLLAALLSLVVGCVEKVVTSLDLTTPVVSWNQSVGFCYKLRAMDAQGSLWWGGGCEGGTAGLDQQGRATAIQMSSLNMHMDLLSNEPSQTVSMCPGTILHVFSRKGDAAASTFSVCSPGQFDDVSNLSGEFLNAAQAFVAVFGR